MKMAWAQGAAAPAMVQEEPVMTLPPVPVTAKGYEAVMADTPVSTTVLTQEDLARKQAPNVGQALRGEPGLAASGDSAQGVNPVIRGLQRESVVLMVDGVRLNAAQPVGAVASFASLGLAEQVEVVKGPASVLYGTGALGGAINVRLPQARFDPGVHWRTGLGFDSASRGTNGVAVMNASGGDHALMLGAALRHDNDYRSPDGQVPRTGYDSRALIGQYRYRIDASQQLRLSVQQQRDDDVWYPGATQPHRLPAVGSVTTHSPRQERTLFEAGYSRARSASQPLGLDVRVYRQQMHRTINGFANGLGRDIVTNDVRFSTNGLDAKAEWLAHPQHVLSFGLNAWQMGASPDAAQAAPPAFTQWTANNPFQDGRLRAVGVFVQDDMQLGQWRVLAGLRHDRVRGSAKAMNNGSVTTGLDRSDGATSGSLGVMYEAAPWLRPYVNLSRGFRAADMRERYQSGLRNDGAYYAGSPQIAPEKATQFELGIKGSTVDVDYSLAFFRNRISHYITGQSLSGASAVAACGAANAAICRQMVNLGSVTLKGFEAGGRWQAWRGHWLSAAYTRIRSTNNDLNEPLYQVPADSLTLGWEGRVTPAWTLDAQARIVARQDRVATVFSRGTEDATPGYTVVDVGATWRYRAGHSLRLAVKNLTNRRYHDHLAVGLPGYEIMAPGRSLSLAWNASF
ncbi:MAG: TonB-dependent receptor [Pseudomonadota bacterium]|nr:TonB-dependent receptor [Pseudomonadota bacterium]